MARPENSFPSPTVFVWLNLLVVALIAAALVVVGLGIAGAL